MFRWLLALSVLGAALPVSAAPVAHKRVDLDGDGKVDTIEVKPAGGAVIRFGSGAERLIPLTQLTEVRRARITVDGAQVLISVEGKRSGEAILVRIRRGQADVVERVAMFEVDADSQMWVDAALVGGELYRFRRRPEIRACDGEPAWLETEKLDRRGRFVDAAPPLAIDARTPRLTAGPRPAGLAAKRFLLYRPVSATSSVSYSADLVGAPVALNDSRKSTSWVEGRPGPGRGERVAYQRHFETAKVAAIRVVQPPDRDFNRPRTLLAELGSSRVVIELADQPGAAQWVKLPAPADAACVSFAIVDVYPGRDRRADRTAIAEIAVATELAFAPGGIESALARAIARGDSSSREAELRLLEYPDAGAAISKVIAGGVDGVGLLRLRRVLARQRIVPAEIAAGLEMREAADPDRAIFAAALVEIGAPAVDALAKVALRAPRARDIALDALTRIAAPEARAALIGLAGKGDRLTRRASALALGARPPAELPAIVAAAEKAGTGRAEADLWRAVGTMARRQQNPELREQAAAAMARAVAEAADYELRYRLLGALGAIDSDGATSAVLRTLEDLRSAQPQAVALRRVAVGALARSPTPAAIAAMAGFAADPDPGVRELALSGLADRGDHAASDAALIDRLESDPWPQLRRTAAGALGNRCARAAPRAALTRAAAREDNLGAGQTVLSSLVSCLGPRAAPSLLAVALSGKRPTRLRSHAIMQLARLGSAEANAKVIELFERFVDESFASARSLHLAQSTAAALCQSGDKRAIAPLLRAARQSAFPELQGAAARALGCFCAPESFPILQDLARSAQVAVSVPARSALRSCRRKRRK